MALALDTVTFTVRDLEESLHFFCDLLRFTKGRVLDYPHLKTKVVYCEGPGGQICLIRDGSRSGRNEPAPVPSPYGYNRIAFSCEDIAAERRRLESLGVRFRSEVIEMPGGRKVAFFAGPEGLEFELVEYAAAAAGPAPDEVPYRMAS
ncbi:MAG TPA: VOC family protein [bacterium]|nr:VOC family protein [bacterium]